MEHEERGAQDVRRVLWRWGRIDRRINELMEQMRVSEEKGEWISVEEI